MSIRLSNRPAVLEDLEELTHMWRHCRRQDAVGTAQANPDPHSDAIAPLRERILDGCVLVGRVRGQAVAMAAIDLDEQAIVDTLVTPKWRRQGLGRRMVAELERRAVQFGMTRLVALAGPTSLGFMSACGYRPCAETTPVAEGSTVLLQRRFHRRQTRYGARIKRLLDRIGISPDYGRLHRLRLQEESHELASIGPDIHGREQMLTPAAAGAWFALRNAASEEGIRLEVVSAYRSVGYQVSIIERKKQAGQSLEWILKVSAAPGFSEHHTGRALDLSAPGSEPLETAFENTDAFEWLLDSAQDFGFRMSFPRHNRHGIAYEPWHWCFMNE